MKLITHIEPTQLRLGYLCCLSLVAGRQLDTRQGLATDRLCRLSSKPSMPATPASRG